MTKRILSLIAYLALAAVAAFGIGFIAAILVHAGSDDAAVVDTVGYFVMGLAFVGLVAIRNVEVTALDILGVFARLTFLCAHSQLTSRRTANVHELL